MKANFKEALKRKVVSGLTVSALLVSTFLAPILSTVAVAAEVANPVVDLRILETTDIHTNILNYDYFQDKPTDVFGLSKASTLIKKQQAEVKNSLLFDNGDLIQGNPLGDYIARVDVLKEGQVHPAVKALNLLGYDAGTVGNHEFNFGLDFLNEAFDDAEFPIVNANVFNLDGTPYFDQYEILTKQVTDQSGNTHTIKVGVTGFVPPQILNWDYGHLNGKVSVEDIMVSANKIIPQMKTEGADVIVVLAHSGIDNSGQVDGMENAAYYLTQVEGVDAVLSGHAHAIFPAVEGKKANFPDGNGFDNVKGTINGVPVTMPGSWADHIGQIDLKLELVNGEWIVADSQGVVLPTAGYASDKALEDAIATEHAATINYVNGPVGTTTAPINSYFALVQDDPSVQIVSNAQKWYVDKWIAGAGAQYKGLPVLSSAAPFKAGGRAGDDASYFTDIPTGTIAIKNVADLYLYPNTVYALKINGSELKEWIEWSAGQFNQIDPSNKAEQSLINYNFRSYNFDVIDGVTYEIDVTQPSKYNNDQALINPEASRVKNLQYNGKPVTADMEFIVATNNYRAGTNKIVNPGGKNTILVAPDENRQAIIDYIVNTGEINPSADDNWKIADIDGDVNVTFASAAKAQNYLNGQSYIEHVETNGDLAKFALNLGTRESWQLSILHTNDTHAHVEQYPKLFTAVNKVRSEKENTLLVDAGDVFSGTLFFNQYSGLADLWFMNEIGYDAMTFGNHEFDKDSTTLANFVSRMNFPMVSSNVNVTKDPVLSLLFKNELGKTQTGGNIYPAIVKEIDGEQVGIFGLTTPDTVILASPGRDIVFEDAKIKATETVARLKSDGVNKIIVLSHMGHTSDLELANAVEGIDVIVGGHSHTTLTKPVIVNKAEPTLIVQANEYLNYLGSLDVTFNNEGVVIGHAGELLELDGFEENAAAAEKVAEFEVKLDEIRKKIIGHTNVVLNGERKDIRTKETNLGNLIADGMAQQAYKVDGKTTIALQNGGGIRASIDKGDITLGDAYTVLPFGNLLVTLDLTGAEILEALEHSVSEVEAAQGKFLQVSGLRFKYDINKPVGERVWLVEVKQANGKYKTLDLQATYSVATNAFTADGGDGFTVFKKAKNEGRINELFLLDADVFTSYVQSNSPVSPSVEGRIIQEVKSNAKPEPKPGKGDGTAPTKPKEVKPTIKNGVVTIDTSSIKSLEANSQLIINVEGQTVFKASFTEEQVKLLKEKGIETVISNNDVEVKIPAANLPNGAFEVHVTKMKSVKSAVGEVYDFKITSKGKEYHKFAEMMTLVFKVDAKKVKNPNHVTVLYYNEEKKQWEDIGGTYKDGFVTAQTNHFSTYGAFEVSGEGKDGLSDIPAPHKGNPLPSTATNTFNLLLVGLLVLGAGVGMFLFKRKRLNQA
ncbi:bifunctional 2',3'-cyclic-nucleotide 2'-phosphodiesterase/3'-nucleotidase [Litchfieldia salsa]|uniref:2',3'-cyclic-nucleotide 2'-phosphodiesterase / 3'-nucleotidase / 5'-nucleotidase n=1 Tax=Litchfieldia salsa TaxID=930152 RepID=A0A1H0QBJ6_9BACI|nr:bifunctional 2',3'-cyclic-nucleotide 2'-phosphodiesterase/3'-nucleotidase [Litchfieldia salsa]SDP14742.1 2',3'-cyclic-nucleotide 2'-phosphodiesterase / 3'-nucleotidase / 5'-nucleotidase [Litchfieldia salsa]